MGRIAGIRLPLRRERWAVGFIRVTAGDRVAVQVVGVVVSNPE